MLPRQGAEAEDRPRRLCNQIVLTDQRELVEAKPRHSVAATHSMPIEAFADLAWSVNSTHDW